MATTLNIIKGEKRNFTMSVHRESGEQVVFDSPDAEYQVRIFPHGKESNVIIPEEGDFTTTGEGLWFSASRTGHYIYANIDTSPDIFVPGELYRIYFKVYVVTPTATVKGYVEFKIVD